MEKPDKDTQDFMNVDSFSQLPFIRPAPVREKQIRLFGVEFDQKPDSGGPSTDSSDNRADATGRDDAKDGPRSEESSRKFECHYCCRNFPTSQALGGHQNAHKRERQHAKRTHLQSTLPGAHPLPFPHDPSSAHFFLNYRSPASFKIGGASAGRFDTTAHYQPWTHPHAAGRPYVGAGSFSHPINGSPLPGLWRIPMVHQSHQAFHHTREQMSAAASPLPLFASGEEPKAAAGGGSDRNGYDSNVAVHEHVSLNLHL